VTPSCKATTREGDVCQDKVNNKYVNAIIK
jgi:hypothetical protein